MAVEEITVQALPPRLSDSAPPTVGTLLTRASAAAAANGRASRARECASPRSLLSRIFHRAGGRGGGFGCRLRLPRYCAGGTAAAKEDAIAVAVAPAAAAKEGEEPSDAAPAPKVAALRDTPRDSLAQGAAKPAAALAEDELPASASLGLGASLVLLLSKSAAELRRMAELRAQMERLVTDARADVRSCSGRPSASGDHTDSASVVREPVAGAGEDAALSRTASRGGSGNAGRDPDMDRMEAELEAELSRLQQQASDDEKRSSRRRDRELQISGFSRSHSAICSDSEDNSVNDDGSVDNDGDEDQYDDDEEEEGDEKRPAHGGVSARELERRLHELLQTRHEARIAELEAALERARRKLRETEREACRWRDTAKLASRFTDESRLR